MKKLLILCSVCCILYNPLFGTANMPEQQTNEEIKGHLFIHGGDLITTEQRQRFLELAGGTNAKILFIPFGDPNIAGWAEQGARAAERWRNLGAQADYIVFEKGDADLEENLRKLDGVTGVWFSGGNQIRHAEWLLGTQFLERIREIYIQGGALGGSSAGAAVMSEIMFTGRMPHNINLTLTFPYIREGNVGIAEGFAFIDFAIIDQHFLQRQRQSRLLNLVIEHNLPGIGIDESTAVIFSRGSRTFEVFGQRTVMVFEPRFVTPPRTDERKNLSADLIEMRILLSGDRYTLK